MPHFQEHDQLIADTERYEPCSPEVGVVRILLCGQIKAGKSSFINTLRCVFLQQIVHDAYIEDRDASVTKKVTTYQWWNVNHFLAMKEEYAFSFWHQYYYTIRVHVLLVFPISQYIPYFPVHYQPYIKMTSIYIVTQLDGCHAQLMVFLHTVVILFYLKLI